MAAFAEVFDYFYIFMRGSGTFTEVINNENNQKGNLQL